MGEWIELQMFPWVLVSHRPSNCLVVVEVVIVFVVSVVSAALPSFLIKSVYVGWGVCIVWHVNVLSATTLPTICNSRVLNKDEKTRERQLLSFEHPLWTLAASQKHRWRRTNNISNLMLGSQSRSFGPKIYNCWLCACVRMYFLKFVWL